MRLGLSAILAVCFALQPMAQDEIEAGVKQIEEILNRIDNCAFLYVVKKETAKSGAAYKRLALHARGPIQCETQMDVARRLRVTVVLPSQI